MSTTEQAGSDVIHTNGALWDQWSRDAHAGRDGGGDQ